MLLVHPQNQHDRHVDRNQMLWVDLHPGSIIQVDKNYIHQRIDQRCISINIPRQIPRGVAGWLAQCWRCKMHPVGRLADPHHSLLGNMFFKEKTMARLILTHSYSLLIGPAGHVHPNISQYILVGDRQIQHGSGGQGARTSPCARIMCEAEVVIWVPPCLCPINPFLRWNRNLPVNVSYNWPPAPEVAVSWLGPGSSRISKICVSLQ